MENYTRIYLDGFGDLELYKNVPISLNYSVAEIQDISKKNTSFSKTINIPGTKDNNEILGQLFDISIADSSFDINAKVACKIYGADITLMKGYFRLMGINKISASSIGGEELIEYEALVFDQTTDFYDKLSDRLLSDLDFSQYNHTYGYSSIIGSSAHTSYNIYTYPMLYNQNTTAYYTRDFQPAIYLKAYIDKAFQTVEYSYDSEFFESDYFKSLIIPFNGEKLYNSQTVIDGRKFQVGISGATNFIQFSGSQSGFTSYSGYTMPFNSDNNTSVPYFDSGSTFNTTTYTFTSDANQSFDLRFKINAHSFATNPHAQSIRLYDIFGNAVLSSAKINCVATLYKNGVLSTTSSNLMNVNIGNTITAGSSTSTGVTTLDYTFSNITAGVGDQFEIRLKPIVAMPLNSIWRLGPAYVGTTPYFPNITIKLDISATGQTNGNNFLLNAPHLGEIADGDIVELNNFIPKNQKIKDVFSSVLKMFNLYVEQDADYENKLIIKTRQDYYSGNTFNDWTSKLAIDKDINIKFIPELQNKDLILTYKQDSDLFNKAYYDQTKEVYGQKKYIFDNDFLSGEKKIELIFSPTPLAKNGFGLTVPGILSQSPKNNIRILYKPNGWTTQTGLSWNFKYTTTGGTVATSTFDSYPYAGHFNSPQFPTEDINFGQVQYLGYSDYGNITDNNLANKFYFNQVDQMLEGKLLTAYFDLSYTDILNLRFSDKVFIKDTYYIINKIQDFNPIEDGLTKVELLKVDDGLRFNTRNKKPIRPQLIAGEFLNTGSTVGVSLPSLPTVKGETLGKNNPFTLTTGSVILGNNTGNIVNSNKSLVAGEGNFIEDSTRTFIIGDDNIADGGSRSMIIGSGNTTSNDSANIVIGNDNIIPNGVESAFIFGSGIEADASNTLYSNNIVISSGGTFNGLPISAIIGVPTLSEVLNTGNTTGGNNIIVSTNDMILGGGAASILLGTTTRPDRITLYTSDITDNSYVILNPSANIINVQDNATGSNSQINTLYSNIALFTNDNSSNITDTISIDPQGLGNGTGIHSENTSTSEVSQIKVEPNLITIDSANIKINSDFSGTSIANLGIDSNGNITTGTTSGISGSFLPTSGGTMTGDIIMATQKYLRNLGGTAVVSVGDLGDTDRLDFVQYHNDFANSIRLKDDIQIYAYDDVTGELHLQYIDANNGFTIEDSVGALFSIKRDNINIVNPLVTGNTNAQVLTRNSSTGNIETRAASTFAFTGGTVAGATTFTSSVTMNEDLTVDDIYQTSHYSTQTTNATVTTLASATLTSEFVYQIEANICAGTPTTTSGYTCKLVGSFKNNGGTVTQIGALNIIENSDFTTATATLDISGTTVRVRITGIAATTIDWGCSLIINRMAMGVI